VIYGLGILVLMVLGMIWWRGLGRCSCNGGGDLGSQNSGEMVRLDLVLNGGGHGVVCTFGLIELWQFVVVILW
jgi:hypothetical protein